MKSLLLFIPVLSLFNASKPSHVDDQYGDVIICVNVTKGRLPDGTPAWNFQHERANAQNACGCDIDQVRESEWNLIDTGRTCTVSQPFVCAGKTWTIKNLKRNK